jgi:proline racemase/trans-L-3-hydroxyproline dehydratase
MAARYARGVLPLGVAYTSESIIGTQFTGHLAREVKLGEYTAVQPVVTGEAYITGIQQFVVDPRDPVKYGFTLGNSVQL